MSERKLLIVDDEECIRYVLEEAFSRAGYTVRSAKSAEEAAQKQLAAVEISKKKRGKK